MKDEKARKRIKELKTRTNVLTDQLNNVAGLVEEVIYALPANNQSKKLVEKLKKAEFEPPREDRTAKKTDPPRA